LLAVFEKNSAQGAFVLRDINADRIVVVGAERAKQRFIPASTFKIINSLIALETGVISDENEVVPYGGDPQPFKAWEQDMSIRQGIRVSNVPVFQELARRIGLERYNAILVDYDFGNMLVGENVKTFWLDGPLKISALEYARILTDLAKQNLPALKHNQKVVRDIIRLERRGCAVFYGKTGWTVTPDPDIGWFIG